MIPRQHPCCEIHGGREDTSLSCQQHIPCFGNHRVSWCFKARHYAESMRTWVFVKGVAHKAMRLGNPSPNLAPDMKETDMKTFDIRIHSLQITGNCQIVHTIWRSKVKPVLWNFRSTCYLCRYFDGQACAVHPLLGIADKCTCSGSWMTNINHACVHDYHIVAAEDTSASGSTMRQLLWHLQHRLFITLALPLRWHSGTTWRLETWTLTFSSCGMMVSTPLFYSCHGLPSPRDWFQTPRGTRIFSKSCTWCFAGWGHVGDAKIIISIKNRLLGTLITDCTGRFGLNKRDGIYYTSIMTQRFSHILL